MWSGIPAPPAPTEAVFGGAGIACAVVGLLLLLGGLRLSRLTMVVIGITAGAACGPYFAARLHFNVYALAAAAAVTGGLFGLIGARFLWGLLLGAVAAAVAAAIVMHLNAGHVERPPVWDDHGLATLTGWLVCLADYLYRWFQAQWAHVPVLLTVALVAPLATGVVVAAMLPRSTTILATSLLGAAAGVGGAWLVLWTWQPATAAAWARRVDIVAIATAALVIVGAAVQAWCLHRARVRAAAEKEAGASP